MIKIKAGLKRDKCSCWSWTPGLGDLPCSFGEGHPGSHSFQRPELDTPELAAYRASLKAGQ
jgi:hypothetical protein